MVQRRGVEVQARVGGVLVAVGAQRRLEVADPHVVAHDGEVVATERLARDRQVARRRGQRLRRVEALVDLPPPRAQARDQRAVARPRRAPQRAPDLPRRGGVDLHAQQVAPRLRKDLRQADGALELPVGRDVGPAGALEQDHRLERVGVDVRRFGSGLDERPVARGARGARMRAAGRLDVDDVRVPARGRRGERVLARGRVGERVVVRSGSGHEPPHARLAREEDDDGDDRERGDGDQRERAAEEGRHRA